MYKGYTQHGLDDCLRTSVCLEFFSFLQSLQDITQHLMMHGTSIQCSGSFYLFCLPALVVPSRLRADVLSEMNMQPLGQVNRCFSSDVLRTFFSFVYLQYLVCSLPLVSNFSVCPMEMSRQPCPPSLVIQIHIILFWNASFFKI